MQVDSRDSSTIVYLKYTSQEVNDWSCINEKICVRVKGIYRPFHLINSYNMPLSSDAEKIHLLYEYPNQEHCFALEFEKVPNGVRFDIIEDEKDPNACNIFDVTPDTTQVSEFVDLAKIGEEYPINRIRGRYIVNNIVVQYVKAKGITLTTYAQTQKLYGKYYTIHLDLQNLSGRSVLLSLKNVNAEAYISKENRPTEVISLDVLDSYAYDKKIRNTQRWNNFWVALSEAAIFLHKVMQQDMLMVHIMQEIHMGQLIYMVQQMYMDQQMCMEVATLVYMVVRLPYLIMEQLPMLLSKMQKQMLCHMLLRKKKSGNN